MVWTDTVTSDFTNEIGETYPVAAQEIFASAMLRQEERDEKVTQLIYDEAGELIYDEAGGTPRMGETTRKEQTFLWSKPYRLTRENNFNDGLALALDPDGGLIIVHNQYSKMTAQSEEELEQLVLSGKLGTTQDAEGNLYVADLSYNSPVSLTVTRFDKIGSLEATEFTFSDNYPVAGQAVNVTAVI